MRLVESVSANHSCDRLFPNRSPFPKHPDNRPHTKHLQLCLDVQMVHPQTEVPMVLQMKHEVTQMVHKLAGDSFIVSVARR